VSHYLDNIMHPRTIAVIGASQDPFKRGHRVIESLVADAYKGQIFPINPREKEILGFKCYPSVADVPCEIDLAIICTAAATVAGMVEHCGKKGIRGALLLAGGFSEASEAGRVLEEELVAVARRHRVRLIGPNTAGMYSARLNCNAANRPGIPPGPLAMISNSANVLRSLEAEARFHGHCGVSIMVSVGNQADVRFDEYVEFCGADPETKAIVSYVEGFKDAPAYMNAARKVSPTKPIVVYAAGRNAEGKRAAKSHSGSISGDYAVTEGVLRQSGVVLVKQSDHLYAVAEALTLFPPMKGRRVAILSEGGGPITIAAESLVERGLVLARLTEDTQQKIHAIVPNASAISNPVDAGGGTEPRVEYYGSISKLIIEDPNVDALLLVGYFGGYVLAPKRFGNTVAETEAAIGNELAELMRQHGKPVMVQTHYAHMKTSTLDAMRGAGVPYQRHIEVAAQCLASAADYSAMKTRLARTVVEKKAERSAFSRKIIETAIAAKRDLLEPEARDLLRACGVAMPCHVVVHSAAELAQAAGVFGNDPCAMKIISKDIFHKSDTGGVKLNLQGLAAMQSAFEDICRAVITHNPQTVIDGVLVTPMAAPGVEVIIGVTRDPQYGPVILFGLGGVFVEVIRDVVFRALPITRDDAMEMVSEVRYGKVFDGIRGRAPVNKSLLVDLLFRVSEFAAQNPEITEIDLNPVIVDSKGCAVVDARMILG